MGKYITQWGNITRSYVDPKWLVIFRIGVGVLFLYKALGDTSTLYDRYADTNFFFTFRGYDWLQGIDFSTIQWLNIAQTISAIGICLGLFFRGSAGVYMIASWILLMVDRTYYENHLYLFVLITFLLMLSSAGKHMSLDRLMFGYREKSLPYWNILILRFQIVLVYFYAGIAKLNIDWLRGEPIGYGLYVRTQIPPPDTFFHNLIIPHIIPWFTSTWLPLFFAYSGLIIDLSFGFLLLFRRTRIIAMIVLVCFSLVNKLIFGLSIFPLFMILSLVLFLPHTTTQPTEQTKPTKRGTSILQTILIVFIVIQIILPLRHFLIPGHRNWTEENKDFSWQMKIRVKPVQNVAFYVQTEKSGEKYLLDVRPDLTYQQATTMAQNPYMIWQFAQYLDAKLRTQGVADPIITADIFVALNTRPFTRFIDQNTDLTSVTYPFFTSAPWILPMNTWAPLGNY